MDELTRERFEQVPDWESPDPSSAALEWRREALRGPGVRYRPRWMVQHRRLVDAIRRYQSGGGGRDASA